MENHQNPFLIIKVKVEEEDLYLGKKKRCIGGAMHSKKVYRKVAPSLFSVHKGESVSKFRFRNYS